MFRKMWLNSLLAKDMSFSQECFLVVHGVRNLTPSWRRLCRMRCAGVWQFVPWENLPNFKI